MEMNAPICSILPYSDRLLMKPLYVLGQPIAHSLSPSFQNAALAAAGLPTVYARREVSSEEMARVAQEVRDGETLGCNITLPHKATAAMLADAQTDAVRITGVANTWWEHDGQLYADNTDIAGLQMSFAALLGDRDAERVVILGAGGAAQATIYALSQVVTSMYVINRTHANAVALLEQARAYLPAGVQTHALVWPQVQDEADAANAAIFAADLVVQTSSVPILKPGDALPFSALALSKIGGGNGALLELAYGKEPTVPMQRARQGGARVLDGATMLLHQGAQSFERWIGKRPNLVVMRDALAAALDRHPDEIAAEIPENVRRRWGLAPHDAACGGS